MDIFKKYLFTFFAFTMLVFSLKAYSITNDEYSKINKLSDLVIFLTCKYLGVWQDERNKTKIKDR